MRKLWLISACLLAMVGQAQATEHVWVLIGVDTNTGPSASLRDTAKDSGTAPEDGGLFVYPSKAACQVDMQRAIRKYAGKSHAEGNYGSFVCADILTWTRGQ